MRWLTFLTSLFWTFAAVAGEVTVAVASNFVETAGQLVAVFERDTDHTVRLVHGSTGQLYAQIVNGAPFDIFLAADQARPARVVADGLALEARSYALGRLVLVSRSLIEPETAAQELVGTTVALADPTVAPYGLAATRAMERLELDTATFRPVLVTNVGQVATIFATGNADAAFLSATQAVSLEAENVLSLTGLHPEIRQDAAFLNRAGGNDAADAFWQMLFSDEARNVIASNSYDLP